MKKIFRAIKVRSVEAYLAVPRFFVGFLKPVKRVLRTIQVHSIEVFLALLCLLAGLPIIFSPAVFAPASVLALLPLPLVFAWGLALVIGGALDLWGIATSNVYVRQIGLLFLAAGAFIMGFSVVMLTGFTRLLAAGVYFIFSWATAARYRELGNRQKEKRRKWEREVKEK